jgi:hypothetical protein
LFHPETFTAAPILGPPSGFHRAGADSLFVIHPYFSIVSELDPSPEKLMGFLFTRAEIWQ